MDDKLVDATSVADEVPAVEGQINMFGEQFGHRHYDQWEGMPPFEQDDQQAELQVLVSFRNAEDRRAFFKQIGQSFTVDTRFIWYPKAEIDEVRDLRWRSRAQGRPMVRASTLRDRARVVRKAKPPNGETLL